MPTSWNIDIYCFLRATVHIFLRAYKCTEFRLKTLFSKIKYFNCGIKLAIILKYVKNPL